MTRYDSEHPYGGRYEYDAEAAKHPRDEYRFAEIFDELIEGGNGSVSRKLLCEATQDGVEISAEMEYSSAPHGYAVIDLNHTSVSLDYWCDTSSPSDGEYCVTVEQLPQKESLEKGSPRRTVYNVACYGKQYVGFVEGVDMTTDLNWSSREMTPYDYDELAGVLAEVLVVQLAEQRERATLV